MLIKGIIDEDFINYKYISMFIALGHCDWKCCIESNIPISVCQNSKLAQEKDIEVPIDEIFNRYIHNPISKAIVIGGLEPMTMAGKIIDLIDHFRNHKCHDDFIIYTGYYPHEIPSIITELKKRQNIIIKFGRYIPDAPEYYNEILGVVLTSNNQYAERIS